MTRNERIKFILERRNIGYEAISEILNVTKGAISNRLNREKEIDDPEFLTAIALAIGIDAKAFTSKGFSLEDFDDSLLHYMPKFTFPTKETKEIQDLQKQIEDYKRAFNDQRDQKLKLEVENEFLKKQLESKDQTIQANNKLIANLERMVSDRDEDIKRLTSDIANKL